MKIILFALLATQLLAGFLPNGGENWFPKPFAGHRREHHGRGVYFNTHALPFQAIYGHKFRKSHHSNSSSCSNSNNKSSKGHSKHSDHSRSHLCANPKYKDAPFCQKPVFTKAGQKIPIFWKNASIAVSPINNIVGGSVQLRTYNGEDDNQKWIFTRVDEQINNDKYYITNAATNLALTSNAYSSPLSLQNKSNALNQVFYVRPQTDGSFFISAFGSDLYWDALEVNSGSLPVLIIRNYEGDITQRWLLN